MSNGLWIFIVLLILGGVVAYEVGDVVQDYRAAQVGRVGNLLDCAAAQQSNCAP